jgi:L-iditol 2-dehydrogenase
MDMLAARLHGPRDLRIERVPTPGTPGAGQVLLRTAVTTICGSDLHSYLDARIGDTQLESPLVLGHEFSAWVEAVGPEPLDGNGEILQVGRLVAVDPATPCHRCEFCERGHPNLCRRLHFCGLWPDDGSLREFMVMPARCCFPVPADMTPVDAALLEPLGIALHSVDLAHLKVAESAAVLGAGPIGLCLVKVAALSGACPIIVTEPLPWRAAAARRLGAHEVVNPKEVDPVEAILRVTHGRGVDVAFEAAWGEDTVRQAGEIACLGGRVVLVGIPRADTLDLRPSAARRKGLTVKFSRRMKHTYPRTIGLLNRSQAGLSDLISHRFPLGQADRAFALNVDYLDQVMKVCVEIGG